MSIPRILIIAGSDSGGGAGIQADIKTVTMLGGHAMTAITAITAQNTLGVSAIHPVPAEVVAEQMNMVVDDLGVDVVKIGMLGSEEIIRVVEQTVAAKRKMFGPIVLDPVMVAKGGASLIDDRAIVALWSFMGTCELITPNIPELERLSGIAVIDEAGAVRAGRELAEATGCAVLVKGGHLGGPDVIDVLIDGIKVQRFVSKRIDTQHSHGTGCTLASAIAVGMGEGRALGEAVARARNYVFAALQAAPGLGGGHGPMGHALGAIPAESVLISSQQAANA